MTTELGGRPTVMTEEVVAKLEESFLKGCNITEACFIAKISRDAYYDYCKANPGYSDRVEMMRENVTIHARRNLVDSILGGNVLDSKWYLERKKKDEFSTSQDLNLAGQENGKAIDVNMTVELIRPKDA